LDTNSNYIAGKLTEIGLFVRQVLAVGDDFAEIQRALKASAEAGQIIILTGGLGPTSDDLTRPAVADFLGAKLQFRQDLMDRIADRYRRRNIPMPDSVKVQAEFPLGAIPIDNRFGSASGIFFRQEDILYFILPGVPREMTGMMENFVLPTLVAEKRGFPLSFRRFNTCGVGESVLSELIGEWNFPQVKLAYLPKYYGVELRILSSGDDIETVEAELERAEAHLRAKIGNYIYAQGEKELVEVIGDILAEHRWTIALAESCTGGLLGGMLTDVPGASDYFIQGYITYSNTAKTELLGVPRQMIDTYGAVSSQVAEEMALGAKARSKTDFAIAITGIAGPSGGTVEKPVGTTYIAVAHPKGAEVKKHIFQDDRKMNRLRACYSALNLLFTILKDYIS
jgi:nicotinamide-nucleotide amidase